MPTWAVIAIVAGLLILVAIAIADFVLDERERRRYGSDDDPHFFERLGRDMGEAADKYEKVRKGRVS